MEKKHQKTEICNSVVRTIETKLWRENFSTFNICGQISFVSLLFGLGMWKLHDDFNVFSAHLSEINVWIEIIRSLELIIYLCGIIAITAEMISEHKLREKNEALMLLIHESVSQTDKSNLLFVFAILYSFFLLVSVFRRVVEKDERDDDRFCIKIIGECYLIAAKLKFSTTALQMKRYFKGLNENLTEQLRNLLKPKTIWLSEIAKDQKMFLHLRDHCDIHWKVCKYVETINQIFRLRLTFIIINMFHKLMFIPYLLVFNLIKTYFENRIAVFVNVSFLIYHMIELLLLVFPPDSATNEPNSLKNDPNNLKAKLRTILNQLHNANETEIILCKHLEFDLSDENIEEMALYLQKLQIHKANFKVYNLFWMNKLFILSMLGAVTTYMIIFIQLQETLNFTEFSTHT